MRVSKVDLIIVDMPKGLLVPHVSMLANVIPRNIHKHVHVGFYLNFLDVYLNTGGCMLLFLLEVKNVKDGVKTYANTCDVTIVKD